MGIFEKIKSAILGRGRRAEPAARTQAPASPAPAAATTATRSSAPTPPPEPVDIEEVMKGYESESQQKLNWRTSIVDLLKLLGMDSSLENRKELARELGYTGSTTDSATMNIWLHKQVLKKLQESGGKVPASLLD